MPQINSLILFSLIIWFGLIVVWSLIFSVLKQKWVSGLLVYYNSAFLKLLKFFLTVFCVANIGNIIALGFVVIKIHSHEGMACIWAMFCIMLFTLSVSLKMLGNQAYFFIKSLFKLLGVLILLVLQFLFLYVLTMPSKQPVFEGMVLVWVVFSLCLMVTFALTLSLMFYLSGVCHKKANYNYNNESSNKKEGVSPKVPRASREARVPREPRVPREARSPRTPRR